MTSHVFFSYDLSLRSHCGGIPWQWMCLKSVAWRLAVGCGDQLLVLDDPTIHLPDFHLLVIDKLYWHLLKKKRVLTDDDMCGCGDIHTVSHMVDSCPLWWRSTTSTHCRQGWLRIAPEALQQQPYCHHHKVVIMANCGLAQVERKSHVF